MAAIQESAIPSAGPAGRNSKKRKFLAPLRMENHDGFAIYFWHGMRAGVWFNLLKRNHFRVTAACLPQVASVSLLSPVNSLLRAISEARFRRQVEGYKLKQPPVFIIGHWRTGTTLLHNLLACDPEFGFPTTYECFMPNHFLLTEPLARFWFDLMLPGTRPPDNVEVGFDRPQEDEFGLCNLGLPSPLLTMALPRQGPVDTRYLDLRDLDDKEQQAWTRGFEWFIRRVAFRQDKRLVLKSPTHTARLRTLVDIFPGARFVHISRNPLSVFPSTVHLWKSMNSTQGLQNPARDDPWLEEYVLDTFVRMFERYEEDRALIPDGHLAEVSYESVVSSPKDTLRRLYDQLDLGDFGRAAKSVDAYLARTNGYQTNSYELPEAKRRLILERWAPYIERFGYDDVINRAAA